MLMAASSTGLRRASGLRGRRTAARSLPRRCRRSRFGAAAGLFGVRPCSPRGLRRPLFSSREERDLGQLSLSTRAHAHKVVFGQIASATCATPRAPGTVWDYRQYGDHDACDACVTCRMPLPSASAT